MVKGLAFAVLSLLTLAASAEGDLLEPNNILDRVARESMNISSVSYVTTEIRDDHLFQISEVLRAGGNSYERLIQGADDDSTCFEFLTIGNVNYARAAGSIWSTSEAAPLSLLVSPTSGGSDPVAERFRIAESLYGFPIHGIGHPKAYLDPESALIVLMGEVDQENRGSVTLWIDEHHHIRRLIAKIHQGEAGTISRTTEYSRFNERLDLPDPTDS